VFNALTFAYVKKDKLEARLERCIFIGYVEGVTRYKLWRLKPEEVRYFVSRDVTFDETRMTMMHKDLKIGEKKVHVEVDPSTSGSDCLETSGVKLY